MWFSIYRTNQRDVDPTHGQPTFLEIHRDAKALLLTPPTEEEWWWCTDWVQNSPDELINYSVFANLNNIDIHSWYKTNDDGYIGIQRYVTYDNVVNDSKDVLTQVDYASSTNNFSNINWVMDYQKNWYRLSLKLQGLNPHWRSTPSQPSYADFTYSYTTSPAIKSNLNEDIIILSATATSSISSITLENPTSATTTTNLILTSFNYPFLNATSTINSNATTTITTPSIGVRATTTIDSLNIPITPASGSVEVLITDSLIDLDYQNSTLTGLTINNIDREINLNNQDSVSMNISLPTGSIDLTIDEWLTSGTYNKQWTATSTTATSTTYTIGDLKANTYYAFKLDGTASTTAITNDSICTDGVCKSDAGGQIIFTYVGGYSTHTFGLEEDETAPASFSLSSPANNSWASSTLPTLSWNASSDTGSGLAKHQLWIDDSLNKNDIATTTTSATPTVALLDGDHTWKIVAFDNAGNSVTSTETWTIRIDTTEPARTNGSPSSALSAGTTQTTLSLTTDETATCKYSTTANTAYGSMTIFSTTNSATHSTIIFGLTNGANYSYYVRCQDAAGNTNSSDYTISFSVSSAGGGIPFWMLNQINNANKTDGGEEDSNNSDGSENDSDGGNNKANKNSEGNNHFAYSKARLKSLPQEQNSAKELKQKLEEFYSKGKIPVHKKHWHTIVNSYIYGDYPIQAIIQAIKFGGKTVHPIIPFSAWKTAKDYLEWIGR